MLHYHIEDLLCQGKWPNFPILCFETHHCITFREYHDLNLPSHFSPPPPPLLLSHSTFSFPFSPHLSLLPLSPPLIPSPSPHPYVNSDSGDASDVDSDVENAIFAELYFRDAKLKPNGSGKQKPVCFG